MKSDIIDEFANRDLVIPSSQFSGAWSKPGEIDLDGDNLIWRQDNPQWLRATEERMHTMLRRFIKLEEADNQQVLDFARRYGVLGICKHQQPASHNQPLTKLPLWLDDRCEACSNPLSSFCTPQQRQDGWANTNQRTYFETIERWHYFSRKARATLNLAKALGAEKPELGNIKDWQVVSDWLISGIAPKTDDMKRIEAKHINTLRLIFSDVINAWLEVTGVRLMFGWLAESTFKFSGPPPWVCETAGILPPLATYIMLLVNRSRGLAKCSSSKCGAIFSLGKKQPGQSAYRGSYCPECQKGKAGSQEATRKYQRRERENPNRVKRRRLTVQQREEIQRHWQDCKMKELKGDFVKRMSNEYGTSKTNVYRIIMPLG